MNKKVTILIIDDKSQDVNIRALKSQLKMSVFVIGGLIGH